MFVLQSQLFHHRPEQGIWGDCHRTCIANILEKPAEDFIEVAKSWRRDEILSMVTA